LATSGSSIYSSKLLTAIFMATTTFQVIYLELQQSRVHLTTGGNTRDKRTRQHYCFIVVQSNYFITISCTGGNQCCCHSASVHGMISPDLGRQPPDLWRFLLRIPVISVSRGSIRGIFSDVRSLECFGNLSRKNR
jgi:hypothetical protein